MARRIFPDVPRVCLQCGAAWMQRDGQAPRDYCTTSCRNDADRQARGGSEPGVDAVADPPARTYLRRVRAKEYTVTCAWCGAVAHVEQYPGPAPRYCSPDCHTEAAREGAAARMRRMRARRQEAPSRTPTPLS